VLLPRKPLSGKDIGRKRAAAAVREQMGDIDEVLARLNGMDFNCLSKTTGAAAVVEAMRHGRRWVT
jgi:hypothetical protein